MTKTMGDMVTRIASEIRRPTLALPFDMTCAISLAILDAIDIWQKDRFRISDIDPSFPSIILTVPGRYIYTVTDHPYIPTIFVIDYLNVMVGTQPFKMARRTPEAIHLLHVGAPSTTSGQPSDFAYEGNQILIYPTPNAAYQMPIGGHVQIAAPVSLTDNGFGAPWMNWAEQLIRAQAKYLIATNITRNPSMASAMSPDADGGPGGKPGETWRAWSRLKRESNKIKSVGRIKAMQW